MELCLDRCDFHCKCAKSQFEVFHIYVYDGSGWLFLHSYRSLTSAKKYVRKFFVSFDVPTRREQRIKISRFNHPFGECTRDYYFSIK